MAHKEWGKHHRSWCRIVSRQGDEMSDAIAAEAREIVRQAAGRSSGLTVKGQIRQAARNLGYTTENWRIREAWYGRAGNWSAQAIRDLQRRYLRWCERTAGQASAQDAFDRALLEETRARYLADLAAIEARLAVLPDPGSADPA